MSARKKPESEILPAPSIARRIGWVIGLGAWLFLLGSLVSFHPADPPTHAAAPWNDPVRNWCGPVGASIAYHGYLVLGLGAWVLLLGLAGFLGVTATGRRVTQPVLRTIGLVLMSIAFAALHALIAPTVGPLGSVSGGFFGIYVTGELAGRFNVLGTFLFVAATFLVGAIVAMDEVVLALPRAVWRTLKFTRKVRSIPLPQVSMPRLSIPGFGGVDARAASTDGSAEETASETRNRRGKKKPTDPVAIDPDAGGVGGVESFVPEEHEIDEPVGPVTEAPKALIEQKPAATAPSEPDDDAEEPIGLIEPARPERKQLSREELKAKIARLPVRMAGKNTAIAKDADIPREPQEPNFESYQFPPLSLLEDPETNYSERLEKFVRDQAQVLEESLRTYGIDGEVVGIDSGPVVTLYAVELSPGTKVAKVTAVASDLARSLRAQNIRIVPNIAGKTAIGIEVPNLQKEKVRLKELMSGGHADKMGLPMFLGKDASGEPLVSDLCRMPHMLIAGTTGSGKSVCMNSIIMSWLYTKRPDELKLVLVDPKMVELSQFQNIPHLMCPVVTEMSKAAAILEWAVTKMEERYELLSEAGVRDIGGYNALTEEELYERFQPQNDLERAKIPKKLPFMVFIIDELADLMMTNKEVEHSIVRIAQKARAVGIHLVLATQRPQANVVTGLIKSNMPCRVSFKVASGMDSRIVLDQKGAELLLGQGDMMFLAPHTSEVKRAQGTLVTDNEIRKVAKFLKEVAAPTFERALLTIRPGQGGDGDAGEGGLDANERDPLFDEAVKVMIESGRGSVSLLQRRLAIGYSRASRLVDQMGLAGILGEHRGSVARDVLITLEEWEEMKRLEAQQEAEGTIFQNDESGDAPALVGNDDAPFDTDDDRRVPDEYGDEYRM